MHTHARAHSHTHSRTRARVGTSASLGRAERTRPTLAALRAPGRRPPFPTPRKPLDRRVARRRGSARLRRPSRWRAAGAAVLREGAGRAVDLGARRTREARGAPGARPQRAGGRRRREAERGEGTIGGRAATHWLGRPVGGLGGGRGALRGVAAGDTLGCLEDSAGGGGTAAAAPPQTSTSGVTSSHRSHLGRLLPFFCHFIF